MNLKKMSLEELKKLETEVKKEIKNKTKKEVGKVHQMHQLIALKRAQFEAQHPGEGFWSHVAANTSIKQINAPVLARVDYNMNMGTLFELCYALNIHDREFNLIFSTQKIKRIDPTDFTLLIKKNWRLNLDVFDGLSTVELFKSIKEVEKELNEEVIKSRTTIANILNSSSNLNVRIDKFSILFLALKRVNKKLTPSLMFE